MASGRKKRPKFEFDPVYHMISDDFAEALKSPEIQKALADEVHNKAEELRLKTPQQLIN